MENKNIPLLTFMTGMFFIILSFLTGGAKGGLFIIFPFIYGEDILTLIGMILILISIFSLFFSLYEEEFGIKEKKGGLIIVGPIPIVITDDRRIGILVILILFFAFLMLCIMFFTQKF